VALEDRIGTSTRSLVDVLVGVAMVPLRR
jgi:hypothetical protein